jgi:hypothetical protein
MSSLLLPLISPSRPDNSDPATGEIVFRPAVLRPTSASFQSEKGTLTLRLQ